MTLVVLKVDESFYLAKYIVNIEKARWFIGKVLGIFFKLCNSKNVATICLLCGDILS